MKVVKPFKVEDILISVAQLEPFQILVIEFLVEGKRLDKFGRLLPKIIVKLKLGRKSMAKSYTRV